jgi:hypothetical protein
MGRRMLVGVFGVLGGLQYAATGKGVVGKAFILESRGPLNFNDAFLYGSSSMSWVLRHVALLSASGLEMLLSIFMLGVAMVVVSSMSGRVKWRYKTQIEGMHGIIKVSAASRMLRGMLE